MPAIQRAKSGGARKIGRNGVRCQQYKTEGRREKNKILRLKRYVNRNIGMVRKKVSKGHHVFLDKQAQAALKRLTT
ncbi:MAG TPA: hypothetical protein ENI27_10590 [bacterium]|nr:hypothetical protein [bacterium]